MRDRRIQRPKLTDRTNEEDSVLSSIPIISTLKDLQGMNEDGLMAFAWFPARQKGNRTLRIANTTLNIGS